MIIVFAPFTVIVFGNAKALGFGKGNGHALAFDRGLGFAQRLGSDTRRHNNDDEGEISSAH